ncbi:MAG: phosphodiester glycosidase family protein, partial [Lachnospiraceae bacterium]|nr:phosphodiester glycosidase family protein [Lachnospiraceae bacterium]
IGKNVKYEGMEDIKFAVSAGNSAIVNGKQTLGFKSGFYNIKKPWKVKFPPSLYPLDYDRDRAPRMAIGALKDGRLVLLWAEGKGKFFYEKGADSCGASLKEMAEICEKMGIYNAVNLDGGGSAQILFDGKRKLMISDRNKEDNKEAERAVPLGLKF